MLIGCDYHPDMLLVTWVDNETGECGELRLTHRDGAQQFYRQLKKKGVSVRVGMEASGHSRWFERLLCELNYELWVGDPAQIRAKQVRKQKNDRRDAKHLLKLMLEDNFPISGCPRRRIAMYEGLRRKRGLRSKKGAGAAGVIAVASLDESTPAKSGCCVASRSVANAAGTARKLSCPNGG